MLSGADCGRRATAAGLVLFHCSNGHDLTPDTTVSDIEIAGERTFHCDHIFKIAPLFVQDGAIEFSTYSLKTLQLTEADQPPVFNPNSTVESAPTLLWPLRLLRSATRFGCFGCRKRRLPKMPTRHGLGKRIQPDQDLGDPYRRAQGGGKNNPTGQAREAVENPIFDFTLYQMAGTRQNGNIRHQL